MRAAIEKALIPSAEGRSRRATHRVPPAAPSPGLDRVLGNQTLQRMFSASAVQTKAPAAASQPPASHTESIVGGLHGRGEPLPRPVRDYMEPRFNADFSAVRVHTGPAADRSTHDINALAYTSGCNIVFRAGHYDPASARGKRLLAHELTHVVQQASAPGTPMLQRQPAADPPEEVQVSPPRATCEDQEDITTTFRDFVRDVPGLIAAAPGWSQVERDRIGAVADFVLHSEGAADIDRYTILRCSRINSWLVGWAESASSYVSAADQELGMLVEPTGLMDEFRRTQDKDVLLRFIETIAHEKRHVTLGSAVSVPASGLRPGRDASLADRAAYRVEEILTTAEEIAIQAMALREDYIVPQEQQFKLFRLRNMLRGWVTETEFERLRTLIIDQLRARYGYESDSCDNTITVGVLHSMETGEWYTCNSSTGQIVRPRAGLNLCERDGRHRLCELRARRDAAP